MRALVIDDSGATRRILAGMMEEIGFEVSQASNGAEGLEVLRRLGTVDVVLVDWLMPEMDGVEFIRAVRAEPELADVRLLMVTTESGLAEVEEALGVGANEYLMKPVTKSMVEDKLEIMGVIVP